MGWKLTFVIFHLIELVSQSTWSVCALQGTTGGSLIPEPVTLLLKNKCIYLEAFEVAMIKYCLPRDIKNGN